MRRPLTCSVKYFCLGAFLIFVGSVLLCGLGFAVVLPHEATRHWPEVTCHVINSTYSSEMCSCDDYQTSSAESHLNRCLESYPCLHVIVFYLIQKRATAANFDQTRALGVPRHPPRHGHKPKTRRLDENIRNHNEVVRRRNPVMPPTDPGHWLEEGLMINQTIVGRLYRWWEDQFYKACAVHECGDEEWNLDQVRAFESLWARPGQTFPCYYDPDDVTQVILERTSTSQMIHAVLWPSVFLLTGLLIWLGLWVGCWEVDMEKYSQPNIDRTQGQGDPRRRLHMS